METLSVEESTYISVDTSQWPALELEILTLPDACHNISAGSGSSKESDFLYRLRDCAKELIFNYPVLRQKLITPIFSFAQPRWVDDPNFDLAYHISLGKSEMLNLSKKFNDDLCIELMQKHATTLDRGSSLWRIFVYVLPAGRSKKYDASDSTYMSQIQPSRYLVVCVCHLALRQRLQTSLSSIFFEQFSQFKSKKTQRSPEEMWCPNGLPSRNDLLEAARSDVSKLPNKFRRAVEHLWADIQTSENPSQSLFNRHSSLKEKFELIKQSQQRWVAPVCSFNGFNLTKPKWSLYHWAANIDSIHHVLKSMRNVNITDGVLTLLADACYSYLGHEGTSRELTALIRQCKHNQAPTLSRISLPNPYHQGRNLRQSVCTLHTALHQSKDIQNLQNLGAIFPQKITKPIAESVQWLQTFQKRNLLWNLCIAEQDPQQHISAAHQYRWAMPLFPGCNIQLMFRVEADQLFVEILGDEKQIDFKKFTDALNRGLRGWNRASQRIEREDVESKKAARLPKPKIDKQQAS